ncbi:MAG: glycoside hydrolase family 35 protein [Sphingobacteriaceae bacterium]
MKKLGCIYVFLMLFSAGFAQPKHQFSLSKKDFLLDGKPFQIISGEMHPARIPKEYWRHRIQLTKAMGCNTIAAYVFWNYHEKEPGIFDFKTENRNIAEFIRICKEEGLWVLLRPGPYVCAEWDFGGLPTDLLSIPDIKIRCMDPRYMNRVSDYVAHLSKEIKTLQCTQGGPILMLQIENEYGSFGNDKEYLSTLKNLWVRNGIRIPFYTSDGATPYMLEAGTLAGAAIGLDSGSDERDFEQAAKFNPNVPAFSGETYPGWLTHWGEKWAKPDTADLKKEMEFLLKNNKSFNLYVIHGGTNFGFTAGANAASATQYQPDITSYDYDAPINEQGLPTPKYFMLQKLISTYTGHTPPNLPAPIASMSIPAISMQAVNSIWNVLPRAFTSPQPKAMEMLGQNQGLMLYQTRLIGHKGGRLTITEPHDLALIYLNHQYIGSVSRDGGKWSIELPKTNTTTENPLLEILVEGMGHINFAQYMIDRKGITDRVTLNGMTLMNWNMYPLPLDSEFMSKASQTNTNVDTSKGGLIFKGTFSISSTADTYFDLSNYQKGVVYINGHNLGRYWNIGPQQRIYCPKTWLKEGLNELVVVDLFQKEPAAISGYEKAVN